MNEPSPAARRAAEAVDGAFTVLQRTSNGLTSFDEANLADLAAIIERETGIGEAIKLAEFIASRSAFKSGGRGVAIAKALAFLKQHRNKQP